jgi:hypothetical protein
LKENTNYRKPHSKDKPRVSEAPIEQELRKLEQEQQKARRESLILLQR